MGNGTYEKDDILTLPWLQQMRLRPGMYIGEIGDGSGYHDCIYILLKEVVDNAVDEFIAGHGKQIDISIDYSTGAMSVRDYGRGIPIGTLVDCVGTMNTSGKYRKGAFKYSAGMNGVGAKAVNALSSSFAAKTFRDGKCEEASFERGGACLHAMQGEQFGREARDAHPMAARRDAASEVHREGGACHPAHQDVRIRESRPEIHPERAGNHRTGGLV